jgi:hypothetical protein
VKRLLLLLAACGTPGKPITPLADTGAPLAPPPDAAPAPLPIAEAADYQVVAVEDGGTVLGLVTAAKLPPPAATAPVPGPAGCPGSVAVAPITMAATGGIVGTLVWLDAKRGKPPGDAPAELRFDACTLSPRAVLVSRELVVRNQDGVRHEVTVKRDQAVVAGFPLPLEGSAYPLVLDRPGLYQVVGDATPTPHALAVVPPHPYYALTDSDGRYRLGGVPAGTYTIHAWHPGVGGQPPLRASASVVVTAAASVEAPLALAP